MVVPDTGGETVQAAAEPENSAGKKIQRKAYFVPPLRVELSSFLIQKIYLSKTPIDPGCGAVVCNFTARNNGCKSAARL